MDRNNWVQVGEGRERLVYARDVLNPKFVIKFPKSEKGLHSNWREYQIYKQEGRIEKKGNGINYARCRLLNNFFLIMEYVDIDYLKHCNAYLAHPAWASYVDCSQVGMASDGEIVCYDYGW